MPRYSVISFEADGIRVLRAHYRKGRISVKDASLIDESGLEVLLRNGREDNFIVVANVNEIYQETLFLPDIDVKLFQPMVYSEIRKAAPELKDISFFYRIIGDSLHDGKQYKKVAVFAYANSDLTPFIDRFITRNKTIRAFYSSSYAMSCLQQKDSTAGGETTLCIADRKLEKLVLLLQNKQLYFARTMQSNGAGFSAADVQNINMTIDYCLQSLRVKPEKAVLLNSNFDLTVPPLQVSVPTHSLLAVPAMGVDPELLADYGQAVGALLCTETAEEGNLLPDHHRDYFFKKNSFKYAIRAMLAVTVVTLAAITLSALQVFDLSRQVDLLRAEITRHDWARTAYGKANGELTRVMPLVTFINKASAGPDFQKTLIALQFLQEQQNTAISSIAVSAGEEQVMSLVITGKIAAASMGDTQAVLDELAKTLAQKTGVEITGRKLDALEKTFIINAQQKKS